MTDTKLPVKKTMLTEDEISMLRSVLHAMLKSKQIDWAADEQHITEVIEALRVSGYIIIPRGVFDAIRKVLDAYEFENPEEELPNDK